jgi:hypothetical protein
MEGELKEDKERRIIHGFLGILFSNIFFPFRPKSDYGVRVFCLLSLYSLFVLKIDFKILCPENSNVQFVSLIHVLLFFTSLLSGRFQKQIKSHKIGD